MVTGFDSRDRDWSRSRSLSSVGSLDAVSQREKGEDAYEQKNDVSRWKCQCSARMLYGYRDHRSGRHPVNLSSLLHVPLIFTIRTRDPPEN